MRKRLEHPLKGGNLLYTEVEIKEFAIGGYVCDIYTDDGDCSQGYLFPIGYEGFPELTEEDINNLGNFN